MLPNCFFLLLLLLRLHVVDPFQNIQTRKQARKGRKKKKKERTSWTSISNKMLGYGPVITLAWFVRLCFPSLSVRALEREGEKEWARGGGGGSVTKTQSSRWGPRSILSKYVPIDFLCQRNRPESIDQIPYLLSPSHSDGSVLDTALSFSSTLPQAGQITSLPPRPSLFCWLPWCERCEGTYVVRGYCGVIYLCY